jgi:hypothetical protein
VLPGSPAANMPVVPSLSRKGGLVLALGCLVCMLIPGSAIAFSKAIWGQVYRNGVNQFPIYKQLGVSVYQADLAWSTVAPTRPGHATNPSDPAYHWPVDIQQAISQAKRFHMRVMLQISTTPQWANRRHSPNWAPSNPANYAAFATAAARRYPSVHLWMVWGEPTRGPNFQPIAHVAPGARLSPGQQTAPHLYSRILDAAYAALKHTSPRNQVIGGCTYTTGDIDTVQWIQNLRLPNGRPPRMDMYAHNPFSWTAPSFSAPPSPLGEVQFSDLPTLAGWIDRYLHRGLPIFLSEWTIPTAVDEEFNFYVDPPTAAAWISEALHLARGWKRIYALGWIHVYDDPPVSYGGLMTVDGIQKPVFGAFARG